MSYFRILPLPQPLPHSGEGFRVGLWGEEESNLRRLRQQIYSLPHLTALESPPAVRLHPCVNVRGHQFKEQPGYGQEEPMDGLEPPTS